MAIDASLIEELRQPAEARLKDGTRVRLRPIRPDDAARLQAFHLRLSPESIYLRWLSAHPVLSDAEARKLTSIDYAAHMAFVAVLAGDRPPDERLLGVARYGVARPEQPDVVEAAVVVEDSYQGRGLGSLLLARLLRYARAQGVHTWEAEINAENRRMLRFIERAGLPVKKRLASGAWQVRVAIGAPDGAAPPEEAASSDG